MAWGQGGAWFLICVEGFHPQRKREQTSANPLTHVDIHMHTYPTEPWLSLLDYLHPCWQCAAIGNIGPCPVWLAGQCAVCPGGLKSQGLAAAATDQSHLNSFPILTPGSTQSAASLGHSTTSSWGGNLRQVQSGLPYGFSWLCCHEIWIQHKEYCS